jgi:RNA polymerase-associated protein CTR9
MTHEKSKEDYYREAAQYLNTGERVSVESGDVVGSTLSFLTRGM